MLGCLIFATVGVIIQALAIKNSMTFKREELDISSKENSETHEKVRNEAAQNGNAEQLERMKGRLKNSWLDQ